MKEIILSITEFFDKKMYSKCDRKEVIFDGFEIITNEQTIVLAIGNEQQCCEEVGYFMTNDNLEDFIGASLESIDYIDDELKVHVVEVKHTCLNFDKQVVYNQYYVDFKRNIQLNDKDNCAMFVNFYTTKGKLQFVAYNAGNGYYSHAFELISKQHTHSTYV